MDNDLQNLKYQLDQIEYKLEFLSQRNEENLNVIANMQIMINNMVTIMNMQSSAMNQINQHLQHHTVKLADIEIMNQNNDNSMEEIKDFQQTLSTAIEEVKAKLDNMKIIYYSE